MTITGGVRWSSILGRFHGRVSVPTDVWGQFSFASPGSVLPVQGLEADLDNSSGLEESHVDTEARSNDTLRDIIRDCESRCWLVWIDYNLCCQLTLFDINYYSVVYPCKLHND